MTKILVPCDFSNPALEAVRFATTIARKSKGEVTLFHIIAFPLLYDPVLVLPFEASYMKDLKAAVVKKLQSIQTKYCRGITSKIVVEFGDLLIHLKQNIKSGKYDLVVMGTKGASGLKEYTIGSNAEKVVRNSTIPVIVLRKSPRAVKNIVFPVIPHDTEAKLVNKVQELQKFFKAKLHIVFINTPSMFRRETDLVSQLQELVSKFQLQNLTINTFADFSEDDGIINFTRFVKGDMVVMRTHGRKGLAHLATASVAEDVVNHIECPIWTYKVK